MDGNAVVKVSLRRDLCLHGLQKILSRKVESREVALRPLVVDAGIDACTGILRADSAVDDAERIAIRKGSGIEVPGGVDVVPVQGIGFISDNPVVHGAVGPSAVAASKEGGNGLELSDSLPGGHVQRVVICLLRVPGKGMDQGPVPRLRQVVQQDQGHGDADLVHLGHNQVILSHDVLVEHVVGAIIGIVDPAALSRVAEIPEGQVVGHLGDACLGQVVGDI